MSSVGREAQGWCCDGESFPWGAETERDLILGNPDAEGGVVKVVLKRQLHTILYSTDRACNHDMKPQQALAGVEQAEQHAEAKSTTQVIARSEDTF